MFSLLRINKNCIFLCTIILCLTIEIVDSEEVNVAVNKPAFHKKSWSNETQAFQAVNNDLRQVHPYCSISHFEGYNWWFVDLQAMFQLTKISIYRRICNHRPVSQLIKSYITVFCFRC